jgi:hypothetical protein
MRTERRTKEMSDVREELRQMVAEKLATRAEHLSGGVADAILERFDVTPKPVVTDEALGMMARRSVVGMGAGDSSRLSERAGKSLCKELEAACLKIVRVSDE